MGSTHPVSVTLKPDKSYRETPRGEVVALRVTSTGLHGTEEVRSNLYTGSHRLLSIKIGETCFTTQITTRPLVVPFAKEES